MDNCLSMRIFFKQKSYWFVLKIISYTVYHKHNYHCLCPVHGQPLIVINNNVWSRPNTIVGKLRKLLLWYVVVKFPKYTHPTVGSAIKWIDISNRANVRTNQRYHANNAINYVYVFKVLIIIGTHCKYNYGLLCMH